MEVIHAFQETIGKDANYHLQHWFGIIPFDDIDSKTGAYLACYCGAWLVPFKRDEEGEIEIGAIWHLRKVFYDDPNN